MKTTEYRCGINFSATEGMLRIAFLCFNLCFYVPMWFKNPKTTEFQTRTLVSGTKTPV